MVISISTVVATPKQIEEGMRILDRQRGTGNSSCFFYVTDGNGTSWNLTAPTVQLTVTSSLLRELRGVFGASNVRIAVKKREAITSSYSQRNYS